MRSEDSQSPAVNLDQEDPGTEHGEQSPKEQAQEQLDQLGLSLAASRSEAIKDRAASGIETEWGEDTEYYEGIDEANRGQMSTWHGKPMGQAALNGEETDDDPGSTVFLNITRTYVDASAARIGDMLLPTDDKGWSIGPTPLPDLIAIAKGDIPPAVEKQIAEDPRIAQSEDPEAEGMQIKQGLVDQVSDEIEAAKDAAEKAEKRIDDWHVEGQYNAENRKILEKSSLMGTGVLKGPIPHMVRSVAYKDGNMMVEEKIQPHSVAIDPWNCFPDLACGDNIHNGSYHWERDEITPKELRSLKEQSGYLAEQIDKCLDEGPQHDAKEFHKEHSGDSTGLAAKQSKRLFEVWYGYVTIEYVDLIAAGWEGDEGAEEDIFVDALVLMVNNHVIKADMNILENGEFPYDYMVWQRRDGMPWGKGVARQVREPQRIINGAARNLMDNAGLAGGPMWAYIQGLISPLDGIAEIRSRKGWLVDEDADLDDVRKAFTFFDMDMKSEELIGIIQWAMKVAEDVTGMPMLMQGQNGINIPDTVGVTQILNNNSGTVLRRLARQYDDKITTPHTRRYYKYLLQYGEDEEKGDFVVEARGSAVLVERDLQTESIAQMGAMVLNPVYKIDPAKWFEQYLQANRLDKRNFEFDDEEWEQVVQQMLNPPPSDSIQVAEIRAQGAMEIQKMKELGAEKDRQVGLGLDQIQKQFDQVKAGGDMTLEYDKLKAKFAELVATLNVQVAMDDREVATPKVEPAGRAEDGKAFIQ